MMMTRIEIPLETWTERDGTLESVQRVDSSVLDSFIDNHLSSFPLGGEYVERSYKVNDVNRRGIDVTVSDRLPNGESQTWETTAEIFAVDQPGYIEALDQHFDIAESLRSEDVKGVIGSTLIGYDSSQDAVVYKLSSEWAEPDWAQVR